MQLCVILKGELKFRTFGNIKFSPKQTKEMLIGMSTTTFPRSVPITLLIQYNYESVPKSE